jgi:HlyD family secretion protein
VAAVSPTLYAPANGVITLLAHPGDTVTKGQTLARLDSPDLASHFSQEQAAMQELDFEYQRTRLDAETQLRQAQENLKNAQVDENTAKRELERSQKAFELGAYSELQMIHARDNFEKAQSALEEAQETLKAKPVQNSFDINGKKASLERQQIVVADLKRQVDALSIRSPVDGQVGQIQVADRANMAKDSPLLTVVDLSALEVEIAVPESFARELTVGMGALLTGTGGEWKGSLGAVSPEVIGGQVTARVRFAGAKPEGLRQNQRLSVRILLEHKDQALQVDRGTFVDQDGGGYAYVVEKGVASRHPVRVGAVSINKVEILDGLKVGDQVVVSGTEVFNHADRVILSN